MYACVSLCVYVYIHVCIYTYICMYVYVHAVGHQNGGVLSAEDEKYMDEFR
jgi:hypothetical protein